MSKVGILTDSTALFPFRNYPGKEHVYLLPTQNTTCDIAQTRKEGMALTNLPSAGWGSQTSDEFRQALLTLNRKYHEIVVILSSSHLCPWVSKKAQEASSSVRCPATIYILDSNTTAAGLGYLVKTAANAVAQGAGGAEVCRIVRGVSPHIYTMLCLPGLVYLIHSGQLDPAQAIVGEMLGIIPLFILEAGGLIPIQKVRNYRQMVDVLSEFVSEFDNLEHIALLQGSPPFVQEARNLRERISKDYPQVQYTEHDIKNGLATLIGPRCLGIVAIEHNSGI
jgi:DegV family protein with EDD domain